MRKFLCGCVLAALVGLAAAPAEARDDARNACRPQALQDLQRLSPRGYAIYQAMNDKKQFLDWINCKDVQLGLATAVHESVHLLTEEGDAYPLIDGARVPRPHQVSAFIAPSKTAANFSEDSFIASYMRPGGTSSASDFLYLLDELNAFGHDLNTAVKLESLRPSSGPQADHRDGLAAMMAFVMNYAETAKKTQPKTWQGLQQPEVKHAIQSLWNQAETVMASSCAIPGFGTRDQIYIAFTCRNENGDALADILGRSPKCASACLDTTASTAK